MVVVHHRHLERLLRTPPSPVLHRYGDRVRSAKLVREGVKLKTPDGETPAPDGPLTSPYVSAARASVEWPGSLRLSVVFVGIDWSAPVRASPPGEGLSD